MAPPKELKRCLYDVIGVSRDAPIEDIKKAYKKGALKLHPDKNRDDPEKAISAFQELNAAYEILSDVHERAWYDSHRNQILRGEDPRESSTDDASDKPKEKTNLWPYFSTTCFEGFGDDDEGFFSRYREVFEDLKDDEVVEGGRSKESIPSFGDSKTEWESVSQFYTWWGSFTTLADFGFADNYNLAEAPNRRIRRLMEKENKKERDNSRKKYRATVRHLVHFVHARDPRVKEHASVVAKKAVEEEAKKKDLASEKEARRLRDKKALEEKIAKMREMDGIVDVDDDSIYGVYAGREGNEGEDDEDDEDDEGDDRKTSTTRKVVWWDNGAEDDDDDEDEESEYYCFACSKRFRSKSSWVNHSKSKKHLQQVEYLRKEVAMEEEGEEEEEAEEKKENSDDNDYDNDLDVEFDLELSVPNSPTTEGIDDASFDKQFGNDEIMEEDAQSGISRDIDGEVSVGMLDKGREKRKRKKQAKNRAAFSLHSDDEVINEDQIEESKIEAVEKEQEEEGADGHPLSPTSSSKKKKRRRAAKSKRSEGGDDNSKLDRSLYDGENEARDNDNDNDNEDNPFPCMQCGKTFSTRNALFGHLKESGHSIALSNAAKKKIDKRRNPPGSPLNEDLTSDGGPKSKVKKGKRRKQQ